MTAWRERLRSFLRIGCPKAKKSGAPKSLAQARLANWHNILALDQALRLGVGFGLAELVPRRRVGTLGKGEKRRWIAVEKLPEAVRGPAGPRTRRGVVVAEDRSTRLEAAWTDRRLVVHNMLDCGSVGWPSRAWAAYSQGCRLERWLDPPHRRHNNVADALSEAGLLNLRAEAMVLCNTNSGPWGGAAHYQRWRDCGEQWLEQAGTTETCPGPAHPATGVLPSGCLPARSRSSLAHPASRSPLPRPSRERGAPWSLAAAPGSDLRCCLPGAPGCCPRVRLVACLALLAVLL